MRWIPATPDAAAIGYLFSTLGRARVHADVLPANEASVRLLRRIGFSRTRTASTPDDEERWTPEAENPPGPSFG